MARQNPLQISVVMPNRNGAAYLEQAIRSVLSAGERAKIEYIVVDGDSTDDSVDIITKYSDRMTWWISETDRGQYDAINKGFNRASGDVLAWLNSDDIYFPWTLATVASIFNDLPEVHWLTTASPGALDADGPAPRFRTVPGYSAEAFFEGRYVPANDTASYGAIQQESTFFRRSLWERAGARLDCSYELAADFELWSRFFQHAELYCVDTPLAAYRYRKDQRGADVDRYMGEVSRCLNERHSQGAIPALRRWTRRLPRRLPLIGQRLATAFGYSGREIVYVDGRWIDRTSRFY